MEKIKNLSVRKTIIFYMTISLFFSFLLSALIERIAYDTQKQIWWKYIDEEKYIEETARESQEYMVSIRRPSQAEMSKIDCGVSELCDFLQTYTVLLLSVIGSCGAVLMFYHNKLRVPIMELDRASKLIADDQLDFQITYENQDEMGQLCAEFEKMRKQLMHNNRVLWQTIEEEKALRAAIAHDIRSPLTVLKGYQEMLMDYIPDGTIDCNRTLEMLGEGMKQIERMDTFIDTMQKLNSLEQRKMVPARITSAEMKQDIEAELAIFFDKGKKLVLHVMDTEESFFGDKEIIMEVLENVLQNALRYAKEQIEISVKVSEEKLLISIKDDGIGFHEDSETVTKAFYQQNAKDSLKHAGLGMYISRIYCEKHGGRLLLENREERGAVVTAVFHSFPV